VIYDGEETSLNIELTGEAPWRLKILEASSHKVINLEDIMEKKVEVQVGQPGFYYITEIQDNWCRYTRHDRNVQPPTRVPI